MIGKSAIKIEYNGNGMVRLFLVRFNIHLLRVIVRYLISKLFFKWKNGFPTQCFRNKTE